MAKISKIIKNDLCLGCGLCEAVSNENGSYAKRIL